MGIMGKQNKRKRAKKQQQQQQKKRTSSENGGLEQYHIFALILASLSHHNLQQQLQEDRHGHSSSDELLIIIHCLHKLLSILSQTPKSPDPFFLPLLSLLPPLLTSKCTRVAATSLQILGAASLLSFEMNEKIALDGKIVKVLVSALASPKRRVSMGACNAVLDLSTTSIGRQCLLESSAIENLIFCFIQVPKSSELFISVFVNDKGNESSQRIAFEEEATILLIDAAITLVNACSMKQLEKIHLKLSENLLVYMKKLWAEVHKKIVHGSILKWCQVGHLYVSNSTVNSLAECIFRLSLNACPFPRSCNLEEVERSLFSCGDISFERFLVDYWEISPLHMRCSNAFTMRDYILNSFTRYADPREVVHNLLSSILQNLISCPPIASDEIDILGFLNEVRNHLGCPIVYEQDIRVLKTQLGMEKHLFQKLLSSSCQGPQVLYFDDILRCQDACKEGYTVALRGVEFRLESIAAIANGLASLFGQPSAGANLYLTPPNSQGLARHRDDHCVFVCQLIGVKQWTISPHSKFQLPRLYESFDCWHDTEIGSPTTDGYNKIILQEGDVLYIPRGFLHEACTIADKVGPHENSGFSLHLTLAIEVDPPFEWEGFAHVALHHWHQNQVLSQWMLGDPLSCDLHFLSVSLMHVAIMLIGDFDTTFRKACLVGEISSLSVAKGWLDINQRVFFKDLIDRINTKSKFLNALESIQAAFERNEDPFLRLRWLRHLNNNGEIVAGQDWNTPLVKAEKFLVPFGQQKEKVETAFMRVKSKFCSEIVFDDVKCSYTVLLEKYKRARKQYTRGMLSLHCNS